MLYFVVKTEKQRNEIMITELRQSEAKGKLQKGGYRDIPELYRHHKMSTKIEDS